MKDSKKIIYLVVTIFTLIIVITGSTYAYFAITASNNNAVTGSTANVGLTLVVNKITPSGNTTDYLVPQLENYLETAINSPYNCIDDNNNTVCQVYKATLTNTGSATEKVKGTITFNGINNMPNLKWKMITDATTIGSNTANTASTASTIFVGDTTLNASQSIDYYFVVWIDEIGSEQTDRGTYGASITFTSSNGRGITSTIGAESNDSNSLYNIVKTGAVLDNTSSTYVTSSSGINFEEINSDTNGKGVYIRNGTQNYEYPIYYYRGDIDNNNVIFANMCFKMVRTTDTGGVKMIYNGVPANGTCNNTGTNTQIGSSKFNSNYTSVSDVGYMYGTRYECASVEEIGWYYAPDVRYENGQYTLIVKDGYNVETKNDISGSNLSYQHYTCGSSTVTTCTSVRYVYYVSNSKAYYITLTNGKKISDALSDMLDHNTTSSTIKGNNSTSGTLDYWYYNSLDQVNDSKGNSYSTYIEDTIYCNDRSFSNYLESGWNPDGGSTGTQLYFGAYGRTTNPIVTCPRHIDKFTVSSSRGNGDLDYPVGLLTEDEMRMAGASSSTNYNYYLYNGPRGSSEGSTLLRSSSPISFSSRYANVWHINKDGVLGHAYVYGTVGVRPVVSLSAGTRVSDGDGSANNPYLIKEG